MSDLDKIRCTCYTCSMKSTQYIARKIADRVMGSLFGSWNKSNRDEIADWIAAALREYGSQEYQRGRTFADDKTEDLIRKDEAEGFNRGLREGLACPGKEIDAAYRRGYEEGAQWQMDMHIRDVAERDTGGGE